MRAQLARVDTVRVQAVIAAALSFAHLHKDTMVRAGRAKRKGAQGQSGDS